MLEAVAQVQPDRATLPLTAALRAWRSSCSICASRPAEVMVLPNALCSPACRPASIRHPLDTALAVRQIHQRVTSDFALMVLLACKSAWAENIALNPAKCPARSIPHWPCSECVEPVGSSA